jgi:RHS repeat-associated protein
MTLASCNLTADDSRTILYYGPETPGVANNLLPLSIVRAVGDASIPQATTTLTYDSIGNVIVADGPLPGSADSVRTRYDAARQVVGVVGADPDGAGPRKAQAQRTVYNADGQVTYAETGTVNSQSEADWSSFVSAQQAFTYYDAGARVSRQNVTAAGVNYAVTDYTYDALGRTDCVAQRLNPAEWGTQIWACYGQTAGSAGPDRITKTVYDAAGQVIQVQSALGTSVQQNVVLAYTANGVQASLNDAQDNRTTYEYDGFDRLAKTRFPLAATGWVSSTTDVEALSYDVNGNVTQRRLRDGQVIGYAYDALNRLTFKDVPADAYENRDVTYTYDLLGRLKSATKADGFASNFTYDALGRKRSEGNGFGTISYQYDVGGRVTRLGHQDGFFVTYEYDMLSNMTAIRENGAGVLATYAYDDLGRRTSLTRGNGTVTSYAYDPLSRLASLGHDFAGTAQDVTSSFTYNPASQIASRSRNNDAYAFTGITAGFTRPYTNNGLNQHSSIGGTAYAYDGRGNLTSDGSKSYAYTSENRLIGTPGGTLFGYDALEQLAVVFTNKADHLMMADGVIHFESNSVTGLLRRHVHGPGTDEPLLTYEGAGTADKRYLHADERGSIIATSNASGQVTQINAYDDHGIPQGKDANGALFAGGTATNNFGRFGYTGQAWIPEIGLYHYKARVYSPTLGRFMQTDPIGYGDGVNLYAYVGGDPINNVDPSGLFELKLVTVCVGIDDGALDCGGQLVVNENAASSGVSNGGAALSGGDGGVGGESANVPGSGGTKNGDQPQPETLKPRKPSEAPKVPNGLCRVSRASNGAGSILGNIATVSAGAALIPSPLSPGLGTLAAFTGGVGGVLSLGGFIGELISCP